MTPEEYLSARRALIKKHREEREKIAPSLASLRADQDKAQARVSDLSDSSTDEERVAAHAALESATKAHSEAQSRFRALRRQIDAAQDDIDEAESNPDALNEKIRLATAQAAAQAIGVDIDNPRSMVLAVIEALVVALEAIEAGKFTADAQAALARGRGILQASGRS